MPCASQASGDLFNASRAAAIVDALQSGASQATAADAAGIAVRTLKLWLARGQLEPAGRYGAFARAVGDVYFQRRPVAFVARFATGARRPRRRLIIPLDAESLNILPQAMRSAIARGDVVPTQVIVRFEPRSARGVRGDRRMK
jgi:hypothetical protein